MLMAPAPGSILLLDGASLACLAFVRSLGRAGIRVAVAECAPQALAGLSRYCSCYLECPSPLGDPAGLRQWLLRELQRGEYDVVTGTTDYTLPLLQEWRDDLRAYARVPVGEPRAFQALFDIVEAIGQRDYTLIQGLMLLVALGYVLVNFLVDLLYAWLDPRITYQ